MGTGLAFGVMFLLGSIAPGSSRGVRVALSYVALTLPLVVALRVDPDRFGFRRERLGLAVISGLGLGAATLLGLGKWSAATSAPGLATLPALAVVAVVEEGLFRGALQSQLVAWLGRSRGVFAGACIFALWHVPQRLLAGASGAELAAGVAVLVAVGVVLGLFMLFARNAAGPAILHTAINWAG